VVPNYALAFNQQKLRAALRRSTGHDPAFTYGFAIHARRHHNGQPTLGIITLNGESLALSEHLVRSLHDAHLWLFGHARIVLAPGDALPSAAGGKTDTTHVPLASMLMHIAALESSTAESGANVEVEAVVKADQLTQPLLILTPGRPAGFPL
jgi:hypothetical protein